MNGVMCEHVWALSIIEYLGIHLLTGKCVKFDIIPVKISFYDDLLKIAHL